MKNKKAGLIGGAIVLVVGFVFGSYFGYKILPELLAKYLGM